jgi:asparagine synthase (glutamine-hydrolysing)
MCGIAGLLSFSLSPSDRERRVSRMIARQAHRGPDDHGVYSSAHASIGMARLAIFDPQHGRQPMSTPDGRYHLVFNGAIYNFREIRASLEPLGWSFRTECDTEVLLASLAQWGPPALSRLRGMFAFALWDSREKTLFAARDALGIKPLYYARKADDTFVFASELNGLLASEVIDATIDPVAVGDYLAWFAVPAPRTIYRGISNLPAGHAITVAADGRTKVTRWWSLPAAKPPPSYGSRQEFIEQLRLRLDDTIRAHRLADVPVGAFLSGGLDSSAIAGLMARNGGKVKTFSVIFNESQFSEQTAARAAAQAFGTDHHEELLTGTRVAADLPRFLASIDQPTGDGLNTFYVSEAARRGGVTVALSGLGGDELFGGYPSFNDMPRLARYIPWWRQIPRGLRETAVDYMRTRGARARKLADILEYGRDLHEICSLRRRVLSEATRLSLLAPEARRLAERQGPMHPMLDDFVFELTKADPIQTVSAWEMRTYMTDVLLRDSDVFSMAHSLELRVPLVDRELVEWWWNQPRVFRHDPDRPKAALADAVAEVVPNLIRGRAKQGFTLPLSVWMQRELKPWLQEVFTPASISRCPWLNAAAVRREWERFAGGQTPDNWGRVWTLAMLVASVGRAKLQ